MKNRMVDLRNHLFATLEALQDEDKPMELDRAKAIADGQPGAGEQRQGRG